MTVVLVPVLNRPERAEAIVMSLRATCDAQLVFLMTRNDRAEIKECRRVARAYQFVEAVVVPFRSAAGDYARKINYGVEATDDEWVFQGADDLSFQTHWLKEALAAAETSGRRVVGTNDLCNPRVMKGGHSTHSLVHRSYVAEVGTVDRPGKLLHEGYFHNYCDDELVHAAKVQHEFEACRSSIVRHLHPMCGQAEMDATYERGLDRLRFVEDRKLFMERERSVFGKRAVRGRGRSRGGAPVTGASP